MSFVALDSEAGHGLPSILIGPFGDLRDQDYVWLGDFERKGREGKEIGRKGRYFSYLDKGKNGEGKT